MEIYNINRKRFRLTQDDFIQKAKIIHNDKYDYSKTRYKKSNVKVCIICKEHGLFYQIPSDHMSGRGCRKCATYITKNKTKLLKDNFIQRANEKHNSKYDYSLVQYDNNRSKIQIICPIHGIFQQRLGNHLNGYGCPKCGQYNLAQSRKYTTNSFIQKAKIIHDDKYDYSLVQYENSQSKIVIICKEHGHFFQKPNAHLSGVGCPKCGRIKCSQNKSKNYEFIQRANEKHNSKYDYSLVQYEKIIIPVKIICPIHGVFEQTPHSHLKGSGCLKCSNQKSQYEDYIKNYLDKLHIICKQNYSINNIEVDFYLPNYNLAIEVDGLYWHSEISGNKDKKYHLNKTLECEKNNIRLLHIWENEFENKLQLLSKLNSIFKIIKRKIMARKCIVKEINSKLKNKFLNKYHVQGEDKAAINLGCFYKNRLVAVMTFGKLRIALGQTHKEGSWELSRYSTISKFNITGGAGKLLKHFERTYKPLKLITYADRRWSQGNLYNQLGFKLNHVSLPNYWYYFHRKIYHRFNFRKNVLKDKLPIFDSNLSEWENMQNNGYDRIWDCGNLVFIKEY